MPGLNDPYAEFYSGSMLSPDRVGNTLVQSHIYGGPTSVNEMYKGIYSDVPKTPSTNIPSLYDVAGPGPDYGALTGMLVDPIYGNGSSVADNGALQAIGRATPHASGTLIDDKSTARLSPSLSYADAFGAAYGAPQRTGSTQLSGASGYDPVGSGPGMWADIADMFLGGFLNGNPGVPTNVTADNGLFGMPAQGFATQPNPPPARPASGSGGGSIPDLYGQPVAIASGKTVPIGTTGTAQDGGYSYAVQPDGSILNTTTGHVTATPTGPVGVAAVANTGQTKQTKQQKQQSDMQRIVSSFSGMNGFGS